MSKRISSEEKFKIIAQNMTNNKNGIVGNDFFEILKTFSTHAPNSERLSNASIIDEMVELMVSNKVVNSSDSFDVMFLNDKYNKHIEELNIIKATKDQRSLNEEEQSRYEQILKNLINPIEKERRLMSEEEFLNKNSIPESNEEEKKLTLERYNKDIEVLNKLKEIKEDRALDSKEQLLYQKSINSLRHPEEIDNVIMSQEEFYLKNCFNVEMAKEASVVYQDKRFDFKEIVAEEIEVEKKKIEKQFGSSKSLEISEDRMYRMAVVNAFHKSFDGKLATSLSAAKIVFNPVGFATGIVVKSAMGIFMQTEAGERLSQAASEKWNKISNKNKPSKLTKSLILGLAAVGVVGLTYAGLEDHLPDTMKEVFEKAIVDSKNAISNIKDTAMNLDGVKSENGIFGNIKSILAGKFTPTEVIASTKDLGLPKPDLDLPKTNTPLIDAGSKQVVVDKTDLNADSKSNGDIEIQKEIKIIELQKGDNLEKIAKSTLGDNPTQEQIKNRVLQIVEFNNQNNDYIIEDANKIIAGKNIKLPTDFSGIDAVTPKFEIKDLNSLNNIEIPYGADITTEMFTKNVLDVVKNSNVLDGLNQENKEEMLKMIAVHIKSLSPSEFLPSQNEPKGLGIFVESEVGKFSIIQGLQAEVNAPKTDMNTILASNKGVELDIKKSGISELKPESFVNHQKRGF